MSIFKRNSEKNKDLHPADARQAAGAEHLGLSVKILGGGCKKCDALEAAAKAALKQLDAEAQIEHVSDFSEIAAYGVMTTPALVINERVVSSGRQLKPNEIAEIIKAAADNR